MKKSSPKSPSWVFITKPFAIVSSISTTFCLSVTLLVDSAKHQPHAAGNKYIADDVSKRHGMSLQVLRSILLSIDLRSYDSATVADCDLEGIGCSSLCLAADIDSWPTQCHCYSGIDTSCCEKYPKVTHTWTRGRIVADENGISDDGQEISKDDEWCSSTKSLRYPSYGCGQNSGKRIRRNGQELSIGGGISKCLDNGRLEEVSMIQYRRT